MRSDYLYLVIMRGICLSLGLGWLALLAWILVDAS